MKISRFHSCVLIAALWSLVALPYPFATIILDTARDISAAAAIVHQGDWPLRGPIINGMFHLGPWWFYLLAAVLSVTASIPATLLFVGGLAGSKFLFAYWCGCRLHSCTFGLLWAIAMIFPSWSALSSSFVGHASLVEASVLAVAWATLRVHDYGRDRDWLLLGTLMAIAFHAHPSTIAAAPALMAWATYRLRRSPVRELRGWMICLIPIIIALLPTLFSEWREGWPSISGAGAYLTASGDRRDGIWDLILGAHVGGAAVLTHSLSPPEWRALLTGACISVAVAGAVGLLGAFHSSERKLGQSLLAGYLAAVLIVWLLRERTPFYMILVLLPFITAMWALGMVYLLGTRGKVIAVAIAGCTLLLGSAQTGFTIANAHQGLVALPTEQISNVRKPLGKNSWHAALPAVRLDRLAQDICQPGRWILHAEVASLVDAALALPAKLNCPDELFIGVGGGAILADADHLLGLTPGWLRRAGISPNASWSDAMRMRPAQVIASPNTNSIPDGSRYPFREFMGRPELRTWKFVADSGQTVLLSHIYKPYDGAQTLAVSANGQVQQPVFETWTTSAWRCRECDSPVRWEVLAYADLNRIDIVLAPSLEIALQ